MNCVLFEWFSYYYNSSNFVFRELKSRISALCFWGEEAIVTFIYTKAGDTGSVLLCILTGQTDVQRFNCDDQVFPSFYFEQYIFTVVKDWWQLPWEELYRYSLQLWKHSCWCKKKQREIKPSVIMNSKLIYVRKQADITCHGYRVITSSL